jgi:hypothetical protein
MAKGYEVLEMLCPTGGWIISDDDFDSIQWVDERPKCTKAQFVAGFDKYDTWKVEQNAAKSVDKAALLDRLGITAEEARLLLA